MRREVLSSLFLQKNLHGMNSSLNRSWIEINLTALENNVRKIKAALPEGTTYIAVVKADAYGHCMPQSIVRFLRGGADMFAVANMYEVSRIRELVSTKPVLVLSPILPAERRLVFEYDAIPALSTFEEAMDFDSLARERGRILDFHVKIDTGMGRFGVWHKKAVPFLRGLAQFKNLRLAGIFTHLSSADCDEEYTQAQIGNFKRVVEEFGAQNIMIHLHASAGLNFINAGAPFNAVRVGLLQYGINPFGGGKKAFADVEPVMSFYARIASVGRDEKRAIATVSAGFADGVPSNFSKKAYVLIRGKRCPILGNVSLDETIVDISAVPEAQEGDEVAFIGSQQGDVIDLPSYSRWTRRIPWESMVAIPKRVARKLVM